MYYAEQKTTDGRWTPVKLAERPVGAPDDGGEFTFKSTGGNAVEMRRVKKIPNEWKALSLDTLQVSMGSVDPSFNLKEKA